ncbi:MAG: hypothetical protein Q8K02_06815 [Flavobacterium sp.]|nr:hypothetical protein [Flavobacterium sp.]
MRNYLLLLFTLTSIFSWCQKRNIINNEAIHFSIKQKKDTVDFLLIDIKTDETKPIFLFCQGSLPLPLFVQTANENIWMIGGGITNFDIEKIKRNYHLIVISMPNTPVIVNEKNLNESYCYVPNPNEPNKFDLNYIKSDYLENYEKRVSTVLKFLRKQKWVDNSKLIVAGHSQGSKVATLISLNNKKVTHLGLFSANPFGRIDQNIRYYRKQAEKNQISWEVADKEIEELYELFRNSHNDKKVKEDINLLAWKSFSRPLLYDWLKIEIPTYLAYGTSDIASDMCDLVPLFYIQNAKTNLTFKRYLNVEHNFFEVDHQGKANYEKENWPHVMNDFLEWTMKKP